MATNPEMCPAGAEMSLREAERRAIPVEDVAGGDDRQGHDEVEQTARATMMMLIPA